MWEAQIQLLLTGAFSMRFLRAVSLALVIVGAPLLPAATADAQMMGGPPGPVPGPMAGPRPDGLFPLMLLLRNASLTSAQQDQLHELMTAHRAQVDPLFQSLKTALDQMSDRLMDSSDTVSIQVLAPLVSKITEIQGQIDQLNLETAVKIRSVLTADQRSQVATVHRQLKSLRDQIDSLVNPQASTPLP